MRGKSIISMPSWRLITIMVILIIYPPKNGQHARICQEDLIHFFDHLEEILRSLIFSMLGASCKSSQTTNLWICPSTYYGHLWAYHWHMLYQTRRCLFLYTCILLFTDLGKEWFASLVPWPLSKQWGLHGTSSLRWDVDTPIGSMCHEVLHTNKSCWGVGVMEHSLFVLVDPMWMLIIIHR